MSNSFSAYLSIFNDWDILPDALATIAPYIDELVVVDGGYAWMMPYYQAVGIDPECSDARVRAAAEACGVPVRFINRVWQNEIEKRMAGYAACRGRYVYRIDADEVLLMHEDRLDAFLAAGAAVAEMDMPVIAAPGLMRVAPPAEAMPRQCMLFDTTQVDAAAHLHYLWLVLGTEGLPAISGERPPVYPEPIAFNSHLTEWRTPATAMSRALFYTLNYTRTFGMHWTAWSRGAAERDIAVIFGELITPATYRDVLLTGPLVAGAAERSGLSLAVTPYGTGDDPRIRRLHGVFLDSLAALNRDTAANGRHFVNGDFMMFDLTTPEATAALVDGGTVTLASASRPVTGTAKLYRNLDHAPWETLDDLPFVIADDRMTITMPATADAPGCVRRILRVQMWCAAPQPVHHLSVARS